MLWIWTLNWAGTFLQLLPAVASYRLASPDTVILVPSSSDTHILSRTFLACTPVPGTRPRTLGERGSVKWSVVGWGGVACRSSKCPLHGVTLAHRIISGHFFGATFWHLAICGSLAVQSCGSTQLLSSGIRDRLSRSCLLPM